MPIHEWKVRSMKTSDSSAAVKAAERAKVTTAVWLGRAIQQAIAREQEPALEGDLELPKWRDRDGSQAVAASPVSNPQVTLDQLVTIAALNVTPKWLRTGALRHIATTIQVDVPVGRPRKALEAPGGDGGGSAPPPNLPEA